MFIDYILGDLKPKRKKEFETHLSECKDCLDLFVLIHEQETEIDFENMKRTDLKENWQNVKDSLYEKLYHKYSWAEQNIETRKYRMSENQMDQNIEDYFQTHIEHIEPYPYTRNKKEYQIDFYISRINKRTIKAEINISKNNQSLSHLYTRLIRDDWDKKSSPLKNGMVSFSELEYGSYQLVIEENTQAKCAVFFELTKDGLIGF
jgi:hypothetical protein